MSDRAPQVMADIAELLAHGYDDASDDHNWMMAQFIYDLVAADRYHVVQVNGRLIALDKLAECDEALRAAEEAYGRVCEQLEAARTYVLRRGWCPAVLDDEGHTRCLDCHADLHDDPRHRFGCAWVTLTDALGVPLDSEQEPADG